ncbi:hypothetical protein B0J17DRAFT_660546 [Rhizoctonia solani]|nr:hypothetical protein B0J17DRAFT_660546 [Rhizoctonia solani]
MSVITNEDGSEVFVGKATVIRYNDHPNEVLDVSFSNQIIHQPEFFFDNTHRNSDRLTSNKIENAFNVHKYQLKIFNMPKSVDGEPEAGSSPKHPIVVRGAVASDFAALLKILYASHFSNNLPTIEIPLIVPAFRITNLLSFSELRAYLLPLAEKNLDDVEKIIFAREFDIKQWIAPAHIRLCKRGTVLSTEEARKLGVDSVLLIWSMREKHRGRGSAVSVGAHYCSSYTGLDYAEASTICSHCSTIMGDFYCIQPSKMAEKPDTYNSALDNEVTKWVGDSDP